MKKILSVLVLSILAIGCAGASPERYCYTAANVAIRGVDLGMTIAGDFYRDGKLTDSQKDKLIAAHKTYQPIALLVLEGCHIVKSFTAADEQLKKLQTEADKMTVAFVSVGAKQ